MLKKKAVVVFVNNKAMIIKPNFLIAVGAVIIVFALLMDTTVNTEYGEINNIGFMQDKQNYLIVGGIITIVGVLLRRKQTDNKAND